ncbi:MAG TPA: hypothetical protein VFW66_08960 [Gemmatimonadales bacterium]|nr:hypothetical protein [Gemmatimonadales bacterium]
MKKSLFLAAVLVLAACGSKEKAATPSSSEMAPAAGDSSGMMMNDSTMMHDSTMARDTTKM